MRSIVVLQGAADVRQEEPESAFRRRHRFWMMSLTLCCLSASIFGLIGLTLALLSLLNMISAAGRGGTLGNVLLAITLPLMVFAAHCLDRIDETNHEIRVAAFPRNLLKGLH